MNGWLGCIGDGNIGAAAWQVGGSRLVGKEDSRHADHLAVHLFEVGILNGNGADIVIDVDRRIGLAADAEPVGLGVETVVGLSV